MAVAGRGATLLLVLVRAYRGLRAGRPSPCRFEPSCSSYALAAIEQHGARRGTWLVLRRLGRCRPLGGHGWDPVPPAAPARSVPTSLIPQGKT